MGVTHSNKKTYPRAADVIGFCTHSQALDVAREVLTVQRDNGNRKDRKVRLPRLVCLIGGSQYFGRTHALSTRSTVWVSMYSKLRSRSESAGRFPPPAHSSLTPTSTNSAGKLDTTGNTISRCSSKTGEYKTSLVKHSRLVCRRSPKRIAGRLG